ncbi:hypothetical protein ACHWQZ_G005066 [Mnemiopsis leidyi]
MPVVHKKSYTAHEAISLMESISISDQESTSSSDDEDSDEETAHRNAFIVLQPPLERPDAVTDEDSDYEDAGDADRLPRRILNADAEISRKSFRENTKLPAETVFKITNSYRKKPSGSTGTSTSQPSNSAKSTDQILPGKQTSSTTSVQLKSDYQGPYWRAEEQICVITGTQLSTENQELSGKKLSGSTAQPSHSAKSTDQILPGKQTYSSTTSVQLKSDYQGPSVRRSTRSTSVSSSDSVVKIKQTPDLGSKRLPESSSASSSVQRTPHTPAASLRRYTKYNMASSSPRKNTSTHFENHYNEDNTPKKVLDNVDIVPSHVLRERNRHSDIFNREEKAGEIQPVPVIRSNDADNDAAREQFKMRQQTSNVFAEAQAPAPKQDAKPHKISNIFF